MERKYIYFVTTLNHYVDLLVLMVVMNLVVKNKSCKILRLKFKYFIFV